MKSNRIAIPEAVQLQAKLAVKCIGRGSYRAIRSKMLAIRQSVGTSLRSFALARFPLGAAVTEYHFAVLRMR